MHWKRIIKVDLHLLCFMWCSRVRLLPWFVTAGTTNWTWSLYFQSEGEFSHILPAIGNSSSWGIGFFLQEGSDCKLAICILLSPAVLILTIYVMDSKVETFCSCSLPALTCCHILQTSDVHKRVLLNNALRLVLFCFNNHDKVWLMMVYKGQPAALYNGGSIWWEPCFSSDMRATKVKEPDYISCTYI